MYNLSVKFKCFALQTIPAKTKVRDLMVSETFLPRFMHSRLTVRNVRGKWKKKERNIRSVRKLAAHPVWFWSSGPH